MDYRKQFRVKPGSPVRLAEIDPAFTDGHEKKSSAEAETARYAQRLRDLQYLLFAEHRRSLLICLQALDTGGKDGPITHVLGAMDPQGTHVYAFKAPSPEEASHDFLWRAHLHAPRRGEVAIFNRSHYEDVLVVRVHGLVPKPVWSERYELINDFEKNLVRNDTHILKFYLHISPEEQLRRFGERLDDPTKQWKISEADYSERDLWPRYMEAYEEAIARTSTKRAPWYVIPANKKWFRNLAVSQILADAMEGWKMKFPPPAANLGELRKALRTEK